jgi:5-methylcytosine-specific restriction endonuclease McrA
MRDGRGYRCAECRAHPPANARELTRDMHIVALGYHAGPRGRRPSPLLRAARYDLTAPEYRRAREACGGRCAYCGEQPSDGALLLLEHMVPLWRGGDHSATNVTFACEACNVSKGSMTPLEYVCVRAGLLSRRPVRVNDTNRRPVQVLRAA